MRCIVAYTNLHPQAGMGIVTNVTTNEAQKGGRRPIVERCDWILDIFGWKSIQNEELRRTQGKLNGRKF